MKAKEYAKRIKADPVEAAQVAKDIVQEIFDLVKSRNAQTDSAIFAILNEQENKWRAIVRLVGNPNLREDGFDLIIRDHMSDLYLPWKEYNKKTKV